MKEIADCGRPGTFTDLQNGDEIGTLRGVLRIDIGDVCAAGLTPVLSPSRSVGQLIQWNEAE